MATTTATAFASEHPAAARLPGQERGHAARRELGADERRAERPADDGERPAHALEDAVEAVAVEAWVVDARRGPSPGSTRSATSSEISSPPGHAVGLQAGLDLPPPAATWRASASTTRCWYVSSDSDVAPHERGETTHRDADHGDERRSGAPAGGPRSDAARRPTAASSSCSSLELVGEGEEGVLQAGLDRAQLARVVTAGDERTGDALRTARRSTPTRMRSPSGSARSPARSQRVGAGGEVGDLHPHGRRAGAGQHVGRPNPARPCGRRPRSPPRRRPARPRRADGSRGTRCDPRRRAGGPARAPHGSPPGRARWPARRGSAAPDPSTGRSRSRAAAACRASSPARDRQPARRGRRARASSRPRAPDAGRGGEHRRAPGDPTRQG